MLWLLRWRLLGQGGVRLTLGGVRLSVGIVHCTCCIRSLRVAGARRHRTVVAPSVFVFVVVPSGTSEKSLCCTPDLSSELIYMIGGCGWGVVARRGTVVGRHGTVLIMRRRSTVNRLPHSWRSSGILWLHRD